MACQWHWCALMLHLVKQQPNTSVIVLKGFADNFRSSEIRMSVFLHQVWRNVSAVNGCRQNESLIKNITAVHQLTSGGDKR